MSQDDLKKAAAMAALEYIQEDMIVGVGTGSTVNYFIEGLATKKNKIEGAVASSTQTATRLKQHGIPVFDLNTITQVPIYVDGADEIDPHLQMIKGGGGAQTREKILATVAKQFICIADETKWVDRIGMSAEIPLPIEVLPMARSYVAREIIKLNGQPVYRENFITDNQNVILDIYNLAVMKPIELEEILNNIVGVVGHGLFAKRPADRLLLATSSGIDVYPRSS